MVSPKLTLLVDIVSPFAYLAFHVLEHDPTFKGVDIEYIPVFLGGIMQDTGNRPPITIKNKGQYVERQRRRWLKRFNVPTADRMPQPFPQSTLQTGRALCAIQQKYPTKLVDAIAALYKGFFVELKPIGSPEVINDVLSHVLSEREVNDVMTSSQSAEIRQQFLNNTKIALDEGCFGLPYFIATNARGEKDFFWGFDHMGQLIDHLGLERKGTGFRAML